MSWFISTSITANSSGAQVAEYRFKAFGEVRYTNGTQKTKYTFTGQYSNVTDFGLLFYNEGGMTLPWAGSPRQILLYQSPGDPLDGIGLDMLQTILFGSKTRPGTSRVN